MISVAYQGEPGAFSEQAALGYFGKRCRVVPLETLEEVFAFVSKGTSRSGIVPIENSVFGSVHLVYDLLLKHRLNISGEVTMRIRHHLMALPGTALKDVRTVFSHPQALGQCSEFLRKLRKAKIAAHNDTAGAAKMVREEQRRTAAAIASTGAARVYGLRILRSSIENNRHNYTRFVVLSKKRATRDQVGKTSLVFALKNTPGALFKALAVFAQREINLVKIESRPLVGRPWEYLFYADVAGSASHRTVEEALNHLKEVTTFFRILGSYSPGKTLKG